MKYLQFFITIIVVVAYTAYAVSVDDDDVVEENVGAAKQSLNNNVMLADDEEDLSLGFLQIKDSVEKWGGFKMFRVLKRKLNAAKSCAKGCARRSPENPRQQRTCMRRCKTKMKRGAPRNIKKKGWGGLFSMMKRKKAQCMVHCKKLDGDDDDDDEDEDEEDEFLQMKVDDDDEEDEDDEEEGDEDAEEQVEDELEDGEKSRARRLCEAKCAKMKLGKKTRRLPWCFAPFTPITMSDGSVKPISAIKVGDETLGGKVTGVMQFAASGADLYDYGGVIVSGDHKVLESGAFVFVRDSKRAILLSSEYDQPSLYDFDTTSHRIIINDIVFADYAEVHRIPTVETLEVMELNQSQ